MGAAFQAVFALADAERAKQVAMAATTMIGEAEFARRVLWPMIDARLNRQFDIRTKAGALV